MTAKTSATKSTGRAPRKASIRKLAKRSGPLVAKKNSRATYRPIAEPDDGPTTGEIKARALKSAIALRDCSLNSSNSSRTQKSCRKVMREQAKKWRGRSAEGFATGRTAAR